MRGKGLSAEAITDAAFELLVEKGYGNYTVRDLAVRLNVRAASLYNHIGGVESINQEVGKRAAKMLSNRIREKFYHISALFASRRCRFCVTFLGGYPPEYC